MRVTLRGMYSSPVPDTSYSAAEQSAAAEEAQPVTVKLIAKGVFAGMWAFTLTAAIVFAIIEAIAHS